MTPRAIAINRPSRDRRFVDGRLGERRGGEGRDGAEDLEVRGPEFERCRRHRADDPDPLAPDLQWRGDE